MFEQALKIDPNDADALAGEAETYAAEYAFTSGTPRQTTTRKYSARLTAPSRSLQKTCGRIMAKSVYPCNFAPRWNEQLRAADAGLAMNPNSALLYARARSSPKICCLGRYEQAKADAQQAMRLSPRDPLSRCVAWWIWAMRSLA